jgi:methyl-accepting chemotaxis protein
MRVTIKFKLAAAFGMVIALSAVCGGVAYLKLSSLNETVDTVIDGPVKRLRLAGDLRTHLVLEIRAEKDMIIASTDAEIATFEKEMMLEREQVRASRDALYATATNAGKALLDKFAAATARQYSVQDKAASLTKLNSNYRARDMLSGEGETAFSLALAAIDRVSAQMQKSKHPDRLAAVVAAERLLSDIERLTSETKRLIVF